MKRNRILILLTSAILTATAACGPRTLSAESIEDSIRQAEDAVAMGDITAAQSAASYIFDDTLSRKNMSASQIARLSMVYMMMADSIDQESNTNRAADLYDLALKTNRDSALKFYQEVYPEHMQYVETLSNHSANRAHPVDISNVPDESEADFESDQDPQTPTT